MHATRGFNLSFPHARVGWRWQQGKGFTLSMDGSAANVVGDGQIAASNVIVQYVRVFASNLHDVVGNPTPYTDTVGSGKAVFFRDGREVSGTWYRKAPGSGTAYYAGSGRYPMAPGRTWVILVPTGTPVHFV